MKTLLLAALVFVVAVCTAAGLALLALSWTAPVPDSWGFRGFTTVFAVTYGGVGAVLAARRPAYRVGWILLVSGAASAIQVFVEEYAIYGFVGRAEPLPGAVLAGWVQSWIWLVGIALIVTWSFLLFPNGALVSKRWRVVGWLAIIDLVVGVGGLAFWSGPLNNAAFADNPFPVLGDIGHPLFLVSFGGLAVLSGASAISLVVRYRRTAGVERQQLKWLALEAVLIAASVALSFAVQSIAPSFKASQVLLILVLGLMPFAIGVAILRYRLYDIDVLINRALVYGATTAAIAAAFFIGIVVLQAILRPLTGGNEVAVAVSTLLSVALFSRVRQRIQGGVDRRFYRARYDAARTIDTFTDELAGEVELSAVRDSLLWAIDRTLQPASASIWLRGSRNDSRTVRG